MWQGMRRLRAEVGRRLPGPAWLVYSLLRQPSIRAFGLSAHPELSRATRLQLLTQIHGITRSVPGAHSNLEILAVIRHVLDTHASRPGCMVEAGSFMGGSTAKFSLAAQLSGRRLFVFDSFKGIPANAEDHTDSTGRSFRFSEGDYACSLEQVKTSVERYGHIECCEFKEGWFEDTMPEFSQPVLAAYVDVDLVSSTRTCLRHLYPLLVPGGRIFSQDGHLQRCVELMANDDFWENEVGYPKPEMILLGERNLVEIVKLDED
jgi:O-methyltransferase